MIPLALKYNKNSVSPGKGSAYCRIVLLISVQLVLFLSLTACDPSAKSSSLTQNNFLKLFSDDTVGKFNRAYRPRTFNFPRDHGPHTDFRQEWWYFTGNVQSTEGQRFGYELSIFRYALKPNRSDIVATDFTITDKPATSRSESSWRSNQIYMAHLAITDIDNKKFYYAERFSRNALGLAGAGVFYKEKLDKDATNLQVWVNDWMVKSVESDVFPVRLSASAENFSINLVLNQNKPIVLQGKDGFSVKGDKSGNASYYYSITRMLTIGNMVIDGRNLTVSGYSWLDREWSSILLEDGQQGWDWFALQLDDDRDIMFTMLRRDDNTLDKHSRGIIVNRDGTAKPLLVDDVKIEVIRHWKSRHSGVSYPAAWKISIPSESLVLQITPAVDDQELNLSVRYWEGAVKVSGKIGENRNDIITGKGCSELVGN